MNIKKMYTVVEITCEHELLNTVNDGSIEFMEKFQNAYKNFEVIFGTIEWTEDAFVCLAKDLC